MRPEREFASTAKYPWRIFWILLVTAVVSALGALPYVLKMFGRKLLPSGLPTTLPTLILMQSLQGLLVFGVIVGVGLLVARKVGLSFPLLERAIYKATPSVEFSATAAMIGGVAAGVVTVLGLYDFVARRTPDWPSENNIPIWMRVLASIYSAIDEELMIHLFLFGLLLWLLQKLLGKPARHASVFWIANGIVALLFGLAYLPGAAALVPLTKLVVLSLMSVSAIAGFVFGYLCWHRGFEAAVLAHLVTNLIAHLVGPLVAG